MDRSYVMLTVVLLCLARLVLSIEIQNPWTVLPEITKQLCPHTCVWRNYSRPSSFHVCCKECSCDRNCYQTGDCCFKELQIEPVSKSTCMPVQSEGRNRTDIQSYYMVDSNPPGGCINEDNQLQRVQCGTIKVAPWGSLNPVTSTNTGTIYRNSKCALCHNDTRFLPWNIYQICKHVKHNNFNKFLDFDSVFNDFNTACHFLFEPVELDKHSRKMLCHEKIVDYCENNESFSVPVGINLSKPEIIRACASGFLSPVDKYANVFCRMCANKPWVDMCELDTTMKFDAGVVFLLDSNKIERLSALKVDREAVNQDPKACKTVDDCVPVLCPIGQVRIDSQCAYFTRECRDTTVVLYLRLTPVSTRLTTDSISTFEKHFKENPEVVMPWKGKWKIATALSYIYPPNDTTQWYLLAVLTKYNLNFKPHTEIDKMNCTLRKTNWTITVRNLTIEFTQSLSGYTPTQTSFPPEVYTPHRFSPVTTVLPVKLSDYVVSVNKLFFCDNIQIAKDTFNLSAKGDLLFYKPTGKFLYSLEFSFGVGEDAPARICVTDSEYHSVLSSASSVHCSSTIMLIQILWLQNC